MVYVDELIEWPKTAKWRYKSACHMFADSVEELHEMALKIGLKRAWFQDRRGFPHYDLVAGKRALAVRAGARSVDNRFMVAFYEKLKDS